MDQVKSEWAEFHAMHLQSGSSWSSLGSSSEALASRSRDCRASSIADILRAAVALGRPGAVPPTNALTLLVPLLVIALDDAAGATRPRGACDPIFKM